MADADDFDEVDATPPPKVRDVLNDAGTVMGAEIAAPYDLDGYLDDPVFRFGFWVGDDTDDAELVAFELTGDQIQGMAKAFQKAADDADALTDTDD